MNRNIWIAVGLAVLVIGCGGAGGGSSSTPLGGLTAGTTGSTGSTTTTGTTGTTGSTATAGTTSSTTTAGGTGGTTTTSTTGSSGSTSSSTAGTTGTSTAGSTTGSSTGISTAGSTGTSTAGSTTGTSSGTTSGTSTGSTTGTSGGATTGLTTGGSIGGTTDAGGGITVVGTDDNSGTSTTTGGTTGTTTGSTTGATTGTTTGGSTGSTTGGSTGGWGSYSSAVVLIYEIDLTNASGNTVVFTSLIGQPVDIKRLRDAKGPLFVFLNHADVPFGTYTGVRIVVNDIFNVIVAATNQGLQKQFSPAISIGNGRSALSYTFPKALTINSTSKVVAVNFNLGDWVDNNGVISPDVQPGSTVGVTDPSHQIVTYMPGFVSNLVPSTSFSLNHGSLTPLHTLVSPATTVTGSGHSITDLKNGQHIILGSVWSETQFSLLASSVQMTGH